MTNKFKLLIVISNGAYVLWFFAPYYMDQFYDESTLNLLSWNGYGGNQFFLNYIPWLFAGLSFISAIGLWFFVNEARYLYFGLIAFSFLSMPLSGFSVQSWFDEMLSFITTTIDGVLFYMCFFSNLKEQFAPLSTLKWQNDVSSSDLSSIDENTFIYRLLWIIKAYKIASWAFACFVGFLFRQFYGMVKGSNLMKKGLSYMSGLLDPFSEVQLQVFTVTMNVIVNFMASLISALICGGILVYIFRMRAFSLSLWSAGMFLILGYRFLFFWKAPTIGQQISILTGPIIAVAVLLSVVYLMQKFINRRTKGST